MFFFAVIHFSTNSIQINVKFLENYKALLVGSTNSKAREKHQILSINIYIICKEGDKHIEK